MPVIPSTKEEEYMLRLELERRKKAALEAEARQQSEERQRLKELHWMHCPKCGQELQEITFRGVKLDQCASCEGVWLDAGELEQLSASDAPQGFLGGLGRLFR